jgi:EAL domain-containing protein (putative c-di-GMP-specific phosphodiesterase class I)
MIKLSCASVRDRYPEGLSDPQVQTWENTVRPHHLKLVINGIENSQDAAFVREKLHVQYLQGYYYDRPELPRLA